MQTIKNFFCPQVARTIQEESADLQSVGIEFRNLLLLGGAFVDTLIAGAVFFWGVVLAWLLGADWRDWGLYTLATLILLSPTVLSFYKFRPLRLKLTLSAGTAIVLLTGIILLTCFPGIR